MIGLLAMLWALMLLGVGVAAYSFGWWWRGRHEAERCVELEASIRREYERPERDAPLRLVRNSDAP